MIVAPRSSSPMLAFSAAGFIAIRTFGVSPGVTMSREAKWIWKLDTPASVPAGRADLRGEVRQRREIVAERRRGVGEASADKLHAVAGISGEPHDDPLPLLHSLGYSTHPRPVLVGAAAQSAQPYVEKQDSHRSGELIPGWRPSQAIRASGQAGRLPGRPLPAGSPVP